MSDDHFTRDPRIDIDGAPTILIGGKPMYIPLLPLRQTKKIVPLYTRMVASDRSLSEENIGTQAKIVHIALTRAYPDILYEDVEDAMSFEEMMAAMPVVMVQSRAFNLKAGAAGEAADPQQAASPSTGTDSSPTS